jgi:hypothetical protein
MSDKTEISLGVPASKESKTEISLGAPASKESKPSESLHFDSLTCAALYGIQGWWNNWGELDVVKMRYVTAFKNQKSTWLQDAYTVDGSVFASLLSIISFFLRFARQHKLEYCNAFIYKLARYFVNGKPRFGVKSLCDLQNLEKFFQRYGPLIDMQQSPAVIGVCLRNVADNFMSPLTGQLRPHVNLHFDKTKLGAFSTMVNDHNKNVFFVRHSGHADAFVLTIIHKAESGVDIEETLIRLRKRTDGEWTFGIVLFKVNDNYALIDAETDKGRLKSILDIRDVTEKVSKGEDGKEIFEYYDGKEKPMEPVQAFFPCEVETPQPVVEHTEVVEHAGTKNESFVQKGDVIEPCVLFVPSGLEIIPTEQEQRRIISKEADQPTQGIALFHVEVR